MAFFEWGEKYSVNIKAIDDQHKKLIDILNNLFDSMKVGKAKDIMGKVLYELVDYTIYHFKTEEDLFRKYGYPELNRHKKEHDELTKQATELKNSFDKGETIITVEVMNFLKDWLNNHIIGTDKKYGPFLNSKGVI
jgi:hemerythrin-like metal-binding protein